jgi:hypothetical protein
VCALTAGTHLQIGSPQKMPRQQQANTYSQLFPVSPARQGGTAAQGRSPPSAIPSLQRTQPPPPPQRGGTEELTGLLTDLLSTLRADPDAVLVRAPLHATRCHRLHAAAAAAATAWPSRWPTHAP